MRLATLIDAVPAAYRDVEIERVVADSRLAGPGALFIARTGTRVDGHDFVVDAARNGCSAVVGSQQLPEQAAAFLHERGVPYLRVKDSAQTLGELAARINGSPSDALTVVGVTGTNGKTTVATLLYELFSALGHRCGLIATTGIRAGGEQRPNAHTTPDAIELQHLLATMKTSGCRYCFMEVTSHAIDQRRTAGVRFAGGIFTTLGHDHLDYHGTIGAYAATKQRFLSALPATAFALSNADDTHGRYMVATTRARIAYYGGAPEALLPLTLDRCDEHGSELRLGPQRLHTTLIGAHNASNLAAAITAASLLGADLDRLIAAVPKLRGPRGRLQRVAATPVLALVDYAHTPEAVHLALAAARSLRPEARLIVVGGCGGDRDRQKRPPIGAALAAADIAIFTSDNPRSEDAQAIIAAMLRGVPPARRRSVHVKLDRRCALELGARLARPGDILLALGKGHESTQEIAGTKYPWDEESELRTALERASRKQVERPPAHGDRQAAGPIAIASALLVSAAGSAGASSRCARLQVFRRWAGQVSNLRPWD